jgi:hypothetical protein
VCRLGETQNAFGVTNADAAGAAWARHRQLRTGGRIRHGTERLVAQSFAPYRYIRQGGWVKTEDDPLDPDPPKTARQTFAAMTHVDEAFLGASAVVLRYAGSTVTPT